MADEWVSIDGPLTLSLNISGKEEGTSENAGSNECVFTPDSARRQRVFNESSKFAPASGKEPTIAQKRHDVFQTLQETLEVLQDEAVVSRDSHKKEGLWCHPFEIPRHPIEKIALKNEEIALQLERQHSKMSGSMTHEDLTEVENTCKTEEEEPARHMDQEGSPFYQKVSISGGDISGVCTVIFIVYNITES